MKKIILLCLIIFIISLTGCAKVIKTEEQDVKVKVINVNHTPHRFYMVGKVPITHPAKYEVTVKYEDKTYTFDNDYLYEKYKDKVGENIDAILTTYIYDDEKVEERITKIKIERIE